MRGGNPPTTDDIFSSHPFPYICGVKPLASETAQDTLEIAQNARRGAFKAFLYSASHRKKRALKRQKRGRNKKKKYFPENHNLVIFDVLYESE